MHWAKLTRSWSPWVSSWAAVPLAAVAPAAALLVAGPEEVRPRVDACADDLHDAFRRFRALCVPDRADRRRFNSLALILLMASAIARWRRTGSAI